VAYVALPSVFNVSVLLVVVVAGFQVSIDGRFWVFTEVVPARSLTSRVFVASIGTLGSQRRRSRRKP
jgi:hypothetical protein